MTSGRAILKATGARLAGVALILIGLFAVWRGLTVVRGQLASISTWPLLGGLGLCLLGLGFVVLGCRLIRVRAHDPLLPLIVASATFAADVGLTILAALWIHHDHILVGSIVGGVAALPPLMAVLFLANEEDWDATNVDPEVWILGIASAVLFEGATVSLAVTSGQGGHPVPEWIFWSAAALPTIIVVVLLLRPFLRALFEIRGRRAAAPFVPQLAGIVVPVGSIVAARVLRSGNPVHGPPAALFGALGAITVAAIAAFVFQQLVLGWLAVEPSGGERDEHQWRLEEQEEKEEEERRRARWRYEEAEHHLSAAARYRHEEERYRLSVLENQYRDARGSSDRRRHHFGWRAAIARPGMTPGIVVSSQDSIRRTGLVLDAVWPRIELVLPAEIRKPFRRADRSVGALRVATASAVITALAWTAIALGWFGGPSGTSTTVAASAGPLLAAAVLLASLRQHATRLYRQRADAVDLYRFDLARSMQLPIPRDPGEFRAAADVLMGWRAPDHLVPSSSPQPVDGQLVSADQFDGLVEGITREVSSTLLPEIRQLERRQVELADLVQNPVLDREQLATLADLVAGRTTNPITEGVREGLEALQQSFYQRVSKLIQEGLESSVLGPPLVNFTGFMVIDLKKGNQGRPSREPGEMISAPVGGLLELSFFVVNDENARGAAPTLESGDQFFVVEPIQIDGGRSAGIVEFDAVADSPTLKPAPNRHTMQVVGQMAAETVFSFRMPEQAGRHEIWFQLYQAGRLIQAVAVHVQARPKRASVKG